MRNLEREHAEFIASIRRYDTHAEHQAAIKRLKGGKMLRCPSCASWMYRAQEWCGFCRHVL